jgi:3-oxoadipate enol-lactonase
MAICDLGDVALHWREDGDPAGAPVVFAHALGLDLRLWDAVIPLLPQNLRLIRYDARGHGHSTCPPGPYSMGALIRDAERLLDRLKLRDCVFVGLSVGGLVAQGLAVKRLDLVRAMVLSNTAVKIGTQAGWQARAAKVQAHGMAAIADEVMARWFARGLRDTPQAALWHDRLCATSAEGYSATCAAIAGADFITPTSGLRLPTLVVAGSEDGATPPDLVQETAGLVRGAQYQMIRGAGHLPPVDQPKAFADLLSDFLTRIGHADGPG